MKRIALTLALACTPGMGALAEGVTPPASGSGLAAFAPGKLFEGITLAELQQVMTAAGFTVAPVQGQNTLDGTSPTGYKFQAGLGDCPEGADPRCMSLNMISYEFNENTNVTLKTINDWNRDAWGARGAIYKTGTSGMTMNVSLTGGVTAAWVTQQITNFDYWMGQYGNFVSGTKPAATTPAAPTTP